MKKRKSTDGLQAPPPQQVDLYDQLGSLKGKFLHVLGQYKAREQKMVDRIVELEDQLAQQHNNK